MQKRVFIIAILFLTSWLVIAQGCMRMRTSDAKAIDEFKKTGVSFQVQTLTIGQHRLHYVCAGNDSLPTIVFIHGSPGSWDAFKQYLDDSTLLKHFYMVSVDRPGFGYSEFGFAQHLDTQISILSPLLQVLKKEKPLYLVGHSLGGPIAVKLTAANPALINGLVLLAGSVDPSEEATESWRSILHTAPLRFFIPGAMQQSNDELLYFKKEVLEIPAALDSITCRVIIVHGTKDPFVPYNNALYAQKQLRHAASVELVTLEGANHFIPWTKFTEIKEVLLRIQTEKN